MRAFALTDSTDLLQGFRHNFATLWASLTAATANTRLGNALLAALIVVLSLAVFIFDTQTPRPIGVLYVVVLLIAATSGRRQWVIWTSVLVIGFLILSNLVAQQDGPRFAIRVAANLTVTFLILRNLAATRRLSEQARILDRTNEATRRGEIRYRTIFETTSVSIWECDLTALKHRIAALLDNAPIDLRTYLRSHPELVREAIGLIRVIDVNEASVRMFGARTKSDLFASMGRLWPVESEPAFTEAMISSCSGEPFFEAEVTLQTLDGHPLELIYTTAHPLEGASHETVFISMVDMTALNRARTALQSLQSELANASRLTSLGELTASIAHEVNQPLAGILANGQAGLRWLRRDQPDIDAAVLSLERLVSDAKRAGSVITGIQSLARNETPERTVLGLNDTVKDSLALLGTELKKANIELVLDLTDPQPKVLAERVQLQQVVINLVLNAIQAMSDPYTGPRCLRISTALEVDLATVAIRDTGPGIDAAVRDRLFTPFSTTKANGMGLGLSICASIIARHGGRISVDANDDGGAVFRFSLPIRANMTLP